MTSSHHQQQAASSSPPMRRHSTSTPCTTDVEEEVRTVFTTKHAAAAMALGLVASNGIVACRVRHGSVEATKRAVDQAWNEMDEDYVVKTCSAFRKRLTAIVEADGDRIE